MIARAIVTSQKGSWRWQNAFRIATYVPRRLKNGKVVWRSLERSAKMSWPQLKRCGDADRYPVGSLHNKPLTPEQIAEAVAERLIGGTP